MKARTKLGIASEKSASSRTTCMRENSAFGVGDEFSVDPRLGDFRRHGEPHRLHAGDAAVRRDDDPARSDLRLLGAQSRLLEQFATRAGVEIDEVAAKVLPVRRAGGKIDRAGARRMRRHFP